MSLDFRLIVEETLGEKAPPPESYAQGVCEDKWAADYLDGSGWDYQHIPTERDYPAVILILESPHLKEFERSPDGEIVQVGPAAGFENGETGYRILHFLCPLYVRKSPRYVPGMPIFLINAVQHQCSLNRRLTKEIKAQRDQVFIAAWNRGGKDDFKARLRSIYKNGDIVVNACTGEKEQRDKEQRDEENLKLIVEAGVAETINGSDERRVVDRQWRRSDKQIQVISDIGTCHPSSLWFERGEPVWTVP